MPIINQDKNHFIHRQIIKSAKMSCMISYVTYVCVWLYIRHTELVGHMHPINGVMNCSELKHIMSVMTHNFIDVGLY